MNEINIVEFCREDGRVALSLEYLESGINLKLHENKCLRDEWLFSLPYRLEELSRLDELLRDTCYKYLEMCRQNKHPTYRWIRAQIDPYSGLLYQNDLFSPKCQMARHVATHLPMYVIGENKSDRFSGYQTRCNGRIVGKETQIHQIPNHMIHLHLKRYKDKYHAETGIKIPGRFMHK